MADFLLQRSFDESLTVPEFFALSAKSVGCMHLYGVEWNRTYRALDGRRCVCWFSSADMESLRVALRTGDTDIRLLWPSSVHDAPGRGTADIDTANVAVERSFDDPVALEDIQAIEDAGAHCLEMRNVTFMRTFFSADRKRMVCLYAAPDVESVREAQREAGMPFETIWGFQLLGPSDVPEGLLNPG
jgi:hypothetical protein